MQAKKKMLAVDDDPNNTTIVEELFGDHHDLRTAATGEEALKTASRSLAQPPLAGTSWHLNLLISGRGIRSPWSS